MFKITVEDTDGNKVVRGFRTSVDTLPEAEIIARHRAVMSLHRNDISLVYAYDLRYMAVSGHTFFGMVSIDTC